MPFNDEETRRQEEQLQKHLNIARSLSKEEREKLLSNMAGLTATLNELAAKPSLTEEELALLERIKKMLQDAAENTRALVNALDENMLRQAYAYYHHIKKLAEDGNPEAIKIYEDLKPSYQASLRSNIGDN